MSETQLDRIERKLDSFIERVIIVETTQHNAGRVVAWIAGIVATLVTAGITAAAALLRE